MLSGLQGAVPICICIIIESLQQQWKQDSHLSMNSDSLMLPLSNSAESRFIRCVCFVFMKPLFYFLHWTPTLSVVAVFIVSNVGLIGSLISFIFEGTVWEGFSASLQRITFFLLSQESFSFRNALVHRFTFYLNLTSVVAKSFINAAVMYTLGLYSFSIKLSIQVRWSSYTVLAYMRLLRKSKVFWVSETVRTRWSEPFWAL